jgi:hypothetical protein
LALALAGNVMDFSLTYYFVILSHDAVELSPLVGAFSFMGAAAVPTAVFTAFVIYSLLGACPRSSAFAPFIASRASIGSTLLSP